MAAELSMVLAILAAASKAKAIGEDGFQSIAIRAANIEFPVDDHAREVLAGALGHDAGLSKSDSAMFA